MSGQEVIRGLIARGMPPHIALGIAGNMQIESDGFKTDVNEYAPIVPGSRGGYGLNQWTGPRRRQFEAFAQSRGADPSDLNTQLDFTVWELQNTEKAAGSALLEAKSPAEAAQIYSQKYLRPGIPHLDRRIAAAEALAQGFDPSAVGDTGGNYVDYPQGQQAGENALARGPEPKAPPEMPQNAFAQMQTAYQMPTNQLAQAGGFDTATNPFLQHMRRA